jgi:hypothetical protein
MNYGHLIAYIGQKKSREMDASRYFTKFGKFNDVIKDVGGGYLFKKVRTLPNRTGYRDAGSVSELSTAGDCLFICDSIDKKCVIISQNDYPKLSQATMVKYAELFKKVEDFNTTNQSNETVFNNNRAMGRNLFLYDDPTGLVSVGRVKTVDQSAYTLTVESGAKIGPIYRLPQYANTLYVDGETNAILISTSKIGSQLTALSEFLLY